MPNGQSSLVKARTEGLSASGERPEQPRLRRRVLNAAVFSRAGVRVLPRLAPGMAKLYNIILNNDLSPRINGEYWLVSRLQNPQVLLDVGFHRGEWTRECSQRFPSAKIYGFDPWPSARVFFDEGDFSNNIQLVDIALSNIEGPSRFYDYDSACNSLAKRDLEGLELIESYDVEVTTLDSWCARQSLDRIDFLKIDVEGYDLAVLEGAHRLLKAQAIDALSFEYGAAWIASRRYLGEAERYLSEHGYSLFKLFPGFLAPFEYRLECETFHDAMFVGLSPDALTAAGFPTRRVHGV